MTRRFAIYYAPEDGSRLARFGWNWLGRAPHHTAPDPLPDLGWPAEFQSRVVEAPRLYGLHATLKPPFALADGCDRALLLEAMRQFCATHGPVTGAPLALDQIDGFLTLRPRAREPAIHALADACVASFDRFRAPPSAAERAGRLAYPLTPRQIEHLERWGYPYVMDQFRFHVTLTGRLEAADHAIVRRTLEARLREVAREELRIASLCLFEQAGAGQWFVLSERVPLAGGQRGSEV